MNNVTSASPKTAGAAMALMNWQALDNHRTVANAVRRVSGIRSDEVDAQADSRRKASQAVLRMFAVPPAGIEYMKNSSAFSAPDALTGAQVVQCVDAGTIETWPTGALIEMIRRCSDEIARRVK